MSHTVEIEGVAFKDMAALDAAVQALAKATGHSMKLEKGGYMREYGGRQSRADYVLKMPTCSYDVGFNKNAADEYTPVVEDMADDVRDTIGTQGTAKTLDGAACSLDDPRAMIGRLQQHYMIEAAEREAARRGWSVSRSTDEKTGIMQLVMEEA